MPGRCAYHWQADRHHRANWRLAFHRVTVCYLLLLTNARSLFICRHSFYYFSCYRRETRMAGLSFYPLNFRYFWPVQYRTTLYDGMW